MEALVSSADVFYGISLALLAFSTLYLLFTDRFIQSAKDKFVFITGCDSGFGKLLAQSLDQDGVHVIAACLTEEGETALKQTCSNKLATVRLDVTKPEQIQQALYFVEKTLPVNKGLWGLVNNAGVSSCLPFEWTSAKDMESVFNVNVFGAVNVTKAMLPLLKKGQGRIVNMSSSAGRGTGKPFLSIYAMSKFSVEAFSDCLRIEMNPFKVSVHIIEPGFTKTNMTDAEVVKSALKERWAQISESTKKEYGEAFMMKSFELVDIWAQSGQPPEHVIKAMRHALLSTHPKRRYRVGWGLLNYLLVYLPVWLTDPLLCKRVKPGSAL